MNTHINIWTDGSCYPNPGPAGAAYCIEVGFNKRMTGGVQIEHASCNEAELLAIHAALTVLGNANLTHLPCIVYTDSLYCVRMLSPKKKLKANTPNKKLIEEIRGLIASDFGGSVRMQHIRGHSGDSNNDLVHDMANQARLVGGFFNASDGPPVFAPTL